jgi:hypothetical protein
MMIGNPRLGQLGYPHVFDYGHALAALSVTVDGTAMTFRHLARGSGQDRSLVYGDSGADDALINAGFPALANADSDHASTGDVNLLNSYATATQATYRTAVRSFTATCRVDGNDVSPALTALSVGDTAIFSVRRHSALPDGDYPVRILQLASGPDSSTYAMTVHSIPTT